MLRARREVEIELTGARVAATELAAEKLEAEGLARRAKHQRAEARTAATELAVKVDRLETAAAESPADDGRAAMAALAGAVWLPGRDRGRGQPFSTKTRFLIGKLLTLYVPPEQAPEVIAAVAEAIVVHDDALKDMELPSAGYVAKFRWELAALNEVTFAAALGDADKVGMAEV